MILRRYGTKYVSVTPNFDSRAMTEIGFMRNSDMSLDADEFGERYERTGGHELAPATSGDVQGEVEDALLHALQEQLDAVVAGLEDGAIAVIENEQGVNHPKTRGTQTTGVEAGVNKMTFQYAVDPPLRVGVYRAK